MAQSESKSSKVESSENFNWTILKANLEVLKWFGLAEHKNFKNSVDG